MLLGDPCTYVIINITVYLMLLISILIPSDTIFADTSKNNTIQEYIDRYIETIILYIYFKQPSTFLLTHKCNQNI